MIFWHESSATEPGGTARDGRAHEPGAANMPAMPVAGIASLISVPEAGRGRRGGSCDHGADCTSYCTDIDRSRYRNRPGYTLRSGSGCLTNGVHLTEACKSAKPMDVDDSKSTGVAFC